MRSWRKKVWVMLVLTGFWLPVLSADNSHLAVDTGGGASGFRNVTVLIVRHAEKPKDGRGLSEQGLQRAEGYADYFETLQLDGSSLTPRRLIAATNSAASERSLLTLQPLAARLGLPVEQDYGKRQVKDLVTSLKKDNTAPVVLIAWHHGHLDKLIDAFGGTSKKLHKCRYWPSDVYNWLVVLRFDEQGYLDESRSEVVQEHLLPGD